MAQSQIGRLLPPDQDLKEEASIAKIPVFRGLNSVGSSDEKWMVELASSMSSGLSEDKTPLGPGEPLIILPTVEDVRCSLEGYAAGYAIPSPVKNVEKAFLKKYWATWKASHSGRGNAMSRIKTFCRYNGQKLAWFLLTSANLSKAAWGALQKNNSQLMIRSYELRIFLYQYCVSAKGNSKAQKTELVTLNWQRSSNTVSLSEIIKLPVPSELPPQPYSSEDVPCSWYRRYHKKDVYGQVWPRQVQLYSNQDS